MKKRLVLVIIPIVIFLTGICVYLLFFNKDEKKSKDETTKMEVRNNLSFALGSNIPVLSDFVDETEGRIEVFFDEEVYTKEFLDTIGEYKVKIYVGDETYEVRFNVFDKIAPEVIFKNVTITEGGNYKAEDFIESCIDNSKEDCIYEIANKEAYTKVGIYDIFIHAIDGSGNIKEGTAKLTITKEKPKKIETKKEVSTETKQGKYGVSEVVTITTTYDVYSDGSIKNKKTKSTSKFDYSSYNAKAKDLIPEAKENRQKYSSFVNDILNQTNAYRAELGLNPLVLDEELTLEAMVRAIESAYTKRYDHTRPDGSYCFTISLELGMKDYNGENLAWGQKDGLTATRWWRNSPGHYANMTGKYFTKLGVGVIKFGGKYLYVQALS